MGSRAGRRPVPSALNDLRGNPGKRAKNHLEPKPKSTVKKPPKLARNRPAVNRAWNKIAPELEELGLLTGLDALAFRMMLEHGVISLEALHEMRMPDGTLQLSREDENGVERKHPMLQIFRDNSNMMLKYLQEFGMTPASRVRLKVEPEEREKSLADILFEAVNSGG